MRMISFEMDNKMIEKLDRVSAVTGLSRSELLREGALEVINHYSATSDIDADGEPSVRDLIKRVMAVLEETRN